MLVWIVRRTDEVTEGQTASVVVIAENSTGAKRVAGEAVGAELNEAWHSATASVLGEAYLGAVPSVVLADTWTPPNYEPLTELADNELPVTDVQALAEHAVAVLDEYTGTEQRCHRLW